MKKVFGIIASLVVCLSAMALTDQEVIKQAMTLHQQGMDEMGIARQLVTQGATIEQLQNLKKQLASGAMQSDGTTANGSDLETTKSRINNGESLSLELLFAEQEEPEKQIFGRNIFRQDKENNSTGKTFEPQMNQATPQNYKLGADDEVIIDVYGASQLQVKQTISPDGKITIDGYGPIHLAGLTIQEATRRLKNTLGSRYQNCQILLSLGQTRSIMVNVMGEVIVPGSYRLSAFADVFNALTLAGGITESGTLRDIKVYRGGVQAASVDIYGFLMDGELKGNIRLEDQDVIIVSAYQEMVQVEGKVKRPMFYEMKKGETLDKLLYYAGGFSGDAYTDAISVSRKNAGGQSVKTVTNDHFEDFALMDGDSISVLALLPRLQNTVEVQGAVFRPGFYGLSDQVKTVRQLVDMASGLSEDASHGRAVLYRMKLDRTYQAVAIDLEGILNGNSADIELKNEDQLFVPSKKDQLEQQVVIIYGEVYKPDVYPYAEDESVEDLILRAGGLTQMASTSKVDIARRVFDPKAKEEAMIKTETFTVELNDNLGVGEHGFILQPFDEVYIRRSPGYGEQMNVSIHGEVVFGGTYAMKTKNDRISELVRAAGGLSRDAYAKGARLQRFMTEDERRRRDQLMEINKAANATNEVSLDKLELDTTYWVGIDLEAAIAHPGGDEDLVLREGDILVIPSINNTVKINGEVLYPNTVSYIEGKGARYYIDQAGGFSNQARRLRAYIIYSNGKVAPTRHGKIMPGCEIVVPSKPERKANNATQWVGIASASASMASVVATLTTVIINATKK